MTTLVLLGHGSPTDEAVNRPVYDHAERLRETDSFGAVREAFLKADPELESVMNSVESEPVVVVPLFMTEGYYVTEVIPRTLEPYLGSRDLRYAAPIGTHEAIADIVSSRVEAEKQDATKPVLALIGHGSDRHTGSRKAIRAHAARLRCREVFESVRSFFLEEPPYIESLHFVCEADRIIVVPMFVSEGHHVREDIPEILGRAGCSNAKGAFVCTDPVGTDSKVAEIALERANAALRADPGHRSRLDTVPTIRGE